MASSGNYVFGISQAATVDIVVGKSYGTWSTDYALATAATATPLNDGVPNLLKYLYDINPTQSMSATDRAALPVVGTDSTSQPGTEFLTLTYRQNAGLSGTTTVMVQSSSDLQTWSAPQAPDISQQVGTAANGDPMMEIGVRSNGLPRQFIRMSVTP